MAKQQGESSFWGEMLAVGLYKRNQGRLTRQLSAVAFLLVIFFGCWTLSQGPFLEMEVEPIDIVKLTGPDAPPNAQAQIDAYESRVQLANVIRLGIPFALSMIGAWVVYRSVNYPRFADFLISVEAEMDKVSWASWPELWRSTLVVISTMFVLGFVLLTFDFLWQYFFQWINFLRLE